MLAESLRSGFRNQSPSRRVLVTRHLRIVVIKSAIFNYQIGEFQLPKHSYQIGDFSLPNRGDLVSKSGIYSFQIIVSKSEKRSY